jgi:hypothetical protein
MKLSKIVLLIKIVKLTNLLKIINKLNIISNVLTTLNQHYTKLINSLSATIMETLTTNKNLEQS